MKDGSLLEFGVGIGSENLFTTAPSFPQIMGFFGVENDDIELHLGGGYNSEEGGPLFALEILGTPGRWEIGIHGEGVTVQEGDESEVYGHIVATGGIKNFLPWGLILSAEGECAQEEDSRFCGIGPGLALPFAHARLSWSVQSTYFEWLKEGKPTGSGNVVISTVRLHGHFHLFE